MKYQLKLIGQYIDAHLDEHIANIQGLIRQLSISGENIGI